MNCVIRLERLSIGAVKSVKLIRCTFRLLIRSGLTAPLSYKIFTDLCDCVLLTKLFAVFFYNCGGNAAFVPVSVFRKHSPELLWN